MSTLAVIIARSGSKGLPHKNSLPIAGKPMLAWTLEHALETRGLDDVIVSTEGQELLEIARQYPVKIIERPAELATDTTPVDAVVRHVVESTDAKQVAILYGNIPVRPSHLTRQALDKLMETGCDSVQSVHPVQKNHPYWMKKVEGDRLLMYEPNAVYRRQDLPPVYMLDGGVIAVTRASLFTVVPGEPHAFLGTDRRAIVTQPDEVVDVDTLMDAQVAQAILSAH